MIIEFIKYIDKLLYCKTTTTTIIKIITKNKIVNNTDSSMVTPIVDVPSRGFITVTNTNEKATREDLYTTVCDDILASESDAMIVDNMICIKGHDPIVISNAVLNRPPIVIDNELNRNFRAVNTKSPFIACINNQERKMAFVDGEMLTRSTVINNINKKRAFITVAKCNEAIVYKRLVPYIFKIGEQDLKIYLTKDWMFLEIHFSNGQWNRFCIDNIGQFSKLDESVKMSYVIARSLIFDLCITREDLYTMIDEDSLALFILNYILHVNSTK